VRDAEQLVARTDKVASTKTSRPKTVSRDVARLEEALSDQLGTKVTLKVTGKERGQLIVDFHGWEHCSSIIEKMHLKEDLES
jgi:ParB family chromosome partitioning protein